MKALICIKINLDPVEFIYVYKRKGEKKINKIDEIEEREREEGRKKEENRDVWRREGKRIPYIVFRISLLEFRAPRYQIDIHFRLTIAYIYMHVYMQTCRVKIRNIRGQRTPEERFIADISSREKANGEMHSRVVEFSGDAFVTRRYCVLFIFFFTVETNF